MNSKNPRGLMILVALALMALGLVGVIRFLPGGGDRSDGLFLFCLLVLVVSAFAVLALALWWPVVFLSSCEFRHGKTVVIAAVLLLIAAFLTFMPALARSQRRAMAVNAKSTLLSAYADIKTDGALTNSWSLRYHVRPYTNRYVIDGTVYQCVLAADSWDYQGADNLLALTTKEAFLYIDPHGAVPVGHLPPGY
jgi:hypothetical protein